jgi:hypothetical protein
MWNLVLVRLVSVGVGAILVHGLRQTYRWLRNHFGCNQSYSKVTRLKWKLDLVHLEIVLILTQNRCSVCAERTIGSEIVWRRGSCGVSFRSFGDSVSVGER